jgi:glycosyltransferase involved in cell wall biosynthesis
MDLPEITILIPAWNRQNFLNLIVMNIKSQLYPHNKIKVIIDDDSEDKLKQLIPSVALLSEIKRHLHPIQLTYINNKPRRSIGKKRNDLIKECKTKIFAFMDSDDLYMNTYLTHSYELMKEKKVGCVATDKMIFCMTSKNFDLHCINCGDQIRQCHEATIVATKKWFRASSGFATKGFGEGKNLFDNGRQDVAISDINKVMMCIQHGENSVDKLQFAKEENKLDFGISEDIKKILKSVLGMKDESSDEEVEVIKEEI